MELIDFVRKQGKQAIFLIPEIALTYQMVLQFYQRFGSRVSILHSRMSAGERYDQYEKAKNGEIDIMIGPRSAVVPASILVLLVGAMAISHPFLMPFAAVFSFSRSHSSEW